MKRAVLKRVVHLTRDAPLHSAKVFIFCFISGKRMGKGSLPEIWPSLWSDLLMEINYSAGTMLVVWNKNRNVNTDTCKEQIFCPQTAERNEMYCVICNSIYSGERCCRHIDWDQYLKCQEISEPTATFEKKQHIFWNDLWVNFRVKIEILLIILSYLISLS